MSDKTKNELVKQDDPEQVLEFEGVAEDADSEPAARPLLPPPQPAAGNKGLGQSLRTPTMIGGLVVLAFFGGFGGWAVTAPLAGAAVATGTVSPDTQRKAIQHLEGGIVREIKVREGSRVATGDMLLTLLDVKASSTYEQDAVQRYVLQARRVRYEAELALLTPATDSKEALAAAGANGSGTPAEPPGLTFPDELEKAALDNKGVAEILDGERQQFHARVEAYGLDLQILEQTIAKARADIVQLQRQSEALARQGTFIDQQIEVYEGLVKQGLESNSKLLNYKQQRAALDGDIVAIDVRITADKESIASSELELKNTRASRVEQITNDLATTRSDLQSIEEKMRSTQDTLERTVIRSPVDGVVVNLQVHTIGGVVAPGSTIMEIVPENDELTIDAHIDPNDIDSVHPGQAVRVQFTAFPQREMPIIKGSLVNVSADTIVEGNADPYYLGKVQISAENLKVIQPPVTMVPGMEAELFIMTRERTFIDYILDPLMRSVRRSFVED